MNIFHPKPIVYFVLLSYGLAQINAARLTPVLGKEIEQHLAGIGSRP